MKKRLRNDIYIFSSKDNWPHSVANSALLYWPSNSTYEINYSQK
jgi:hypothetical protein